MSRPAFLEVPTGYLSSIFVSPGTPIYSVWDGQIYVGSYGANSLGEYWFWWTPTDNIQHPVSMTPPWAAAAVAAPPAKAVCTVPMATAVAAPKAKSSALVAAPKKASAAAPKAKAAVHGKAKAGRPFPKETVQRVIQTVLNKKG